MRVLLDENLPFELAELLTLHSSVTSDHRGWKEVKNGQLLRLAEDEFDVLLTMDRGILFQHNHSGRRLRVGVLVAHNSRISSLKPLVPNALNFIADAESGNAFIRVDGIERVP